MPGCGDVLLCILLIALPLQKAPRETECSVFVDAELRPYPDQWAFLATIRPMDGHDIEATILRATDGGHPLDVTFIDDEDLATPWKRQRTSSTKLLRPETLARHRGADWISEYRADLNR